MNSALPCPRCGYLRHTPESLYADRAYALSQAILRWKKARECRALGFGELEHLNRESMRWWSLRWRGKRL